MGLLKDFAVVLEKSKALNQIRILEFATGKWRNIIFPEPVHSAVAAGNPEYDTH